MREAWKLQTPDLIISITGGAKHFELPARLRKAFQLGIVSVAATTSKSKHLQLVYFKKSFIDAWIMTQGTNTGVVKEVGEALNKYRYTNQKDGLDIPCIGIASWGYTAGKDQLERSHSTVDELTTDSNGHVLKKTNRFSIGIDALQSVRLDLICMFSYI